MKGKQFLDLCLKQKLEDRYDHKKIKENMNDYLVN
jgi:hypothetical protein